MKKDTSFVTAHWTVAVMAAACAILWTVAGCGGGNSESSSGGPPPITTAGLTHYWTGDSNLNDIAGGSNVVNIGGVSFVAGLSGQALQFSGVDQYLDIPDLVVLNPHADTDRLSAGGWFYIDPNAVGNKGDLSMLISKSNGNTVGGGWFLTFDDRGVPAGYPANYSPPFSKSIWFAGMNTNGVYGGTNVIARADNVVTSAGWYQVMATFDPSAMPQAVLYVNGIAVGSSGVAQIPFITNSGFTGRIGAAHTNEYGGKDNDRLNGLADEIRYYNRALTPLEVKTIFNAGAASAGLPKLP